MDQMNDEGEAILKVLILSKFADVFLSFISVREGTSFGEVQRLGDDPLHTSKGTSILEKF
jgi:hypothetical protein